MEATKQIIMAASAARTATGVSDIFYVPQGIAVAYLDVTASSGTSETLDVTIVEVDPSNATDVYTIITFTQATGVTNQRKTVNPLLGNLIQAKWTHGGTTPSFTFSLYLQLKES